MGVFDRKRVACLRRAHVPSPSATELCVQRNTAMRREHRREVTACGAPPLAGLVLATNVVTGLLVGGILPWMVSTAAAWGLLATVVLGFAYWPLAVDPARAGIRPIARLRLAALLAFAHPVRLGALALVLLVILAASTVVFAALVTVSVALCAFISCRYVLPAADRLEARLAGRDANRADGINGASGVTRSQP